MSMCSCPESALCPLCLDGRFSQLKGVAACRGEAWAVDVALRVRHRQPWPSDQKAKTIAARKVADLARDPRLLVMLANELERWAAKRWGVTA